LRRISGDVTAGAAVRASGKIAAATWARSSLPQPAMRLAAPNRASAVNRLNMLIANPNALKYRTLFYGGFADLQRQLLKIY
jgi:hypothetical protein